MPTSAQTGTENRNDDFVRANIPLLALMKRCGEHLGGVLSGKEDPRTVMFPEGDLSAVERVYRDTPQSRYYNDIMASAVKGIVDSLPPDRRISVLEVGAGTGSATSSLLPLLPKKRSHYVFTDVSGIFAARARRRFADYPFVEYRTLDISRDAASQGFAEGGFDVVVCADVLHAVPDLLDAVRNIGRLSAGGGILLLREIMLPRPSMGFEISFGCLLDPLKDTDFRKNTPFLTPDGWIKVLTGNGFDKVRCFPDPEDKAFDEHIIIARNAGAGRHAFSEQTAVAPRETAVLLGRDTGHPLLGNRFPSPLGITQYASSVSIARLPFLGGHKVFNIVVVPGTAHFDLAAAAGMDYFAADAITLENVVLREAFILDKGERTLQVLVTPRDSGAEFRIFSQSVTEGQAGGDWHLHVSGSFSSLLPHSPQETVDLEQFGAECADEVDVASYYEKFAAYGAVQYGPAFRGLRRLRRSPGGAAAEVVLDSASAGSGRGFVIHPAVLDSCLQSMVAALVTRENDLTGDGFMPFSVEKIIFYGRASETVRCRAEMQEGASVRQDMFSASFRIYTPEGRLVCEIVNLTMKKTNRETLELLKAGQQHYDDLCYDIAWHQVPPPVDPGKREGPWLIFACRDTSFAGRLAGVLEEGGRKSTLVTYRTDEPSEGIPVIDPENPGDFIRVVGDWLAADSSPAGAAFLWGLDCREPDFTGKPGEAPFKVRTAEAFLHLVQALGRHEFTKRLRLAVVTCQAQAVLTTDVPVPAQSLLWGLEKSVAGELGSLRPLIVDLDPVGVSENDLSTLRALFNAEEYREDKAALRGGKVYAPRLVRSLPTGRAAVPEGLVKPAGEAFSLDFSSKGIGNIRALPFARRLPDAGEIEIAVEAYGVNFQNVMVAAGIVEKLGTPVFDCAGTVTAVGSGVTRFRQGDRAFTTAYGTFASHVYAGAKLAAKIPSGFSAVDAASIPTVFMTARRALIEVARLGKGESVLLHSATGGVGLAAVQTARSVGAEIYATAGTERKRAVLRSMGIKHVFSSRSTDFERDIKAVTDGRGVDVVLNFLTRDLADSGMRCLRPGGRFVEIGKTDIRTAEQVASLRGDIEYLVVDLEKTGERDADHLRRIFRGVMRGFEDGSLHPVRRRVFTMDAVSEAFRYMLEGRHIGKVIVKNEFAPVTRAIRPEACYIITGGMSEVGLALAEHLAGRGVGQLWLLGRHAPQPGSEQEKTVARIRSGGCGVNAVQVDVTDRAAMRAFFDAHILHGTLPLAGVFHLAGILDDDVLTKLDWDRFNKVLSPKVDGSWFLHELTRDMRLDHFVVFSSIASVFGTHGQADHVAANTFMDVLAAARRADFLPALTVNWGAWGTIGTVARMGILERIRRQGIDGFDTAVGMAVLDRLMEGTDVQKVVAKVDWDRLLPVLQVGAGAAMFEKLQARRPAVPLDAEQDAKAGDEAAQRLRALPMEKRIPEVRAYLKKAIAGFLRISEGAVPDDAPVNSFGMDSLVSLDLFQRISRDLNIRIAPHEISVNPTVTAMADKFARDLGPDVQKEEEEKEKGTAAPPVGLLTSLFVPAPEDAYKPFPLSDMQQAYWLGRRQDGMPLGGVGCHFYFEAEVRGLDVDRYEKAWNRLIRRRSMLRTVVPDGESQQVLEEVPPYVIRRHDLRSASDGEIDAETAKIRREMSHEVLNIAVWPNFRIEISEFPANIFRTHFSFDLILSDFRGISLMLWELGRIYAGQENLLPELDITFRDYRLAEERYRRTRAYSGDRDYWLKRIDALPPAPKLPTAVSPGSIPTPTFVRKTATIEQSTWEMIKKRGATRGLTPTAVTLAVFSEVLGFWSEDPQFTVNVTLFNRLPVHSRVSSLVGEFTSNSLLAVDLAEGGSFETRTGRIWSRLWDDMEHRSFSGIRVLREMNRRRGGAAGAMPVVFTSTLAAEFPANSFAPDELGHEVFSISQTPQVWLDHQLFEVDRGLRLIFDYVDGLFPDGMVDDMFDAYVDAVKRLAGDESAWGARTLPALTARLREMRDAVNRTELVLPECLMFDPFLEKAGEKPDAPAVITKRRTLSYGELEAISRNGALLLRREGLQLGQPVAVFMEKGLEQPVAVLAVQRAGGAYLPVDVNEPAARIREILKDAQTRFVLGQSWVRQRTDFGDGVVFFPVDDLSAAEPGAAAPEPGTKPGDLAYVIYTSGSTGKPKGVMISHAAAVNTILDVNRRFGVGPDDRMPAVSRLSFDLSVYDIFGMLAAGGAVVIPEEDDALRPDVWPGIIRENNVTLWNTVPALGQMLADALEKDGGTLPLRLMILSGDRIPVALPPRLAKLLPGIRIIAMGGATEASIWSNFHETGPHDAWEPSIPYGRPLANQGFAVLDRNLADRPDLVPGDLYITGKGLALGYLNDAEQTERSFPAADETRPRMYRTGDSARYRPDGNLEFLGRKDTQVKIHGYRVELGEIEAALRSHPAVGNAVVVLKAGAGGDLTLASYIEADKACIGQLVVEERGDSQLTGSLLEQAGLAGQAGGLDRESFLPVWEKMKDLYIAAVHETLEHFGVFSEKFEDAGDLIQKKGIAPRYRKWLERAVKALVGRGLAAKDKDGVRKRTGLAPDLGDCLAACGTGAGEIGCSAEEIGLLDRTVRNLPAVLREDLHSAELYTSDSLPGFYQKAFALGNHIAAAVAAEAARAAVRRRPYRILEVGAGYGSATRLILPALPQDAVRYDFTDISRFFLTRAEKEFREFPFVDYRIMDLNDPPELSGFEPHSHDLIFAGNVLHDTADIKQTLRNIARFLKPAGLLLIQEETSFQLPFDLAMGLQQGFDSAKDEEFRPENPLLSRDLWRSALVEAGFSEPVFIMPASSVESEIGLEILLCEGPAAVSVFTPKILEDFLRERLPGYMVPSSFRLLAGMPLTVNGKVDRKRLAETGGRALRERAGSVAPRTAGEKIVADIWKDILNVERVDVASNFFLNGGDSLSAFQLLRRLQDRFHCTIELRDIMQAPTVADQAALVERMNRAQSTSPLVKLHGGTSQATVCLAHPVEGLVNAYALLAESLPDVPFYALQSLGIDGNCPIRGDFEIMVETALDAVQPLLNRGPVLFGGWSMGAFLAWETAARLHRRGDGYRLLPLVLIDPPDKDAWDRLYDEKAVNFTPFTELAAPDPAAAAWVETHGPAIPAGPAESFVEGPHPGALFPGAAGNAEMLARVAEVTAANLKALRAYRPEPLGRPVLYVRGTASADTGRVDYWRGLTKGAFEVLDVDADHWTILKREDCVAAISGRLARLLAEKSM
jgi:amino acid adenylation domain-containing protein